MRSRLLAFVALLTFSTAECHTRPPGRSLVLVVIDTLRRDHLAPYGYPRAAAPTLERLAREGAVLEGVSPSSWTKPATASLLTGLHPLRHQAITDEDALPEEATTLAEDLRSRGYNTLAASANISVSPGFGFAQGFDTFLLGKGTGFAVGPGAEELNRELLPRLESLRPPYFLYVHYVDPHTPYAPSSAWDGAPLVERAARRRPVAARDLASTESRSRPADFLGDVVDLYDGEVRAADRGVAELLARLQELGLMGSTLTLVTSDHGEEFQEHGRMEHGQTLYEEVLQVPMILHAPGLIAPGRRRGPVSLLDVVPTALDLLGAGMPGPPLDGRDLAPALRATTSDLEASRGLLFHLDLRGAGWLAFEQGRDKLVLGRGPYRKELFDLGRDQGERQNLAADPRGAAAFARLAARLADAYNDLAGRALPRTAGTPSPEVLEALRGLGYISQDGLSRRLPAAIQPAPQEGAGLLGWEGVRAFSSCVEPAAAAAAPQLLDGWWPVELGGRWTRPVATAALAVPQGTRRLVFELRGMNWDRRPARLRVRLDGRSVVERTIPPGPVALAAAVEGPVRSPALLEIHREPAFIPSELGFPDGRELGLLVTSACLVGAP